MAHLKYACDLAIEAVNDASLTGLNGKQKEILIISFYTAEVHQRVLNGDLSRDKRSQIALRTVDGSQGFSADLVIVDFVQAFLPWHHL